MYKHLARPPICCHPPKQVQIVCCLFVYLLGVLPLILTYEEEDQGKTLDLLQLWKQGPDGLDELDECHYG